MNLRSAFVLMTGLTSVCSSAVVLGVCVIWLRMPLRIADVKWVALTVLVTVAVSLWIGYRFIQPIRRRLYSVEEAAALLASGRLHHRVAVMGAVDEIDQLGLQFNQMGAQIEHQVRMLQELAEDNQRLAAETERAAALEERQRLARELHDSVSQQLFTISMLAATARRHASATPETLLTTLDQLEELANAAQREMRALLLELRPVELDGRPFFEAVCDFLSAIGERNGLQTSFDWRVPDPLGPAIEEQFFRILQEAVANVMKHAQATTVSVSGIAESGTVVLTIMDDGVGIEVDSNGAGDAYGLRSMRERAASVGGTFDVWRRAQGTAVSVRVPVFEEGESV